MFAAVFVSIFVKEKPFMALNTVFTQQAQCVLFDYMHSSLE